MEPAGLEPIRTRQILDGIFGTDVQNAMMHPEEDKEAMVKLKVLGRPEIKQIALDKLLKGGREKGIEKLEKSQKILAQSIVDAATQLVEGRPGKPEIPGNPKLTQKIFDKALEQTGQITEKNQEERARLATEMKMYAAQLLKQSEGRIRDLRMKGGITVEEIRSKPQYDKTLIDQSREELIADLRRRFDTLIHVDRLAIDIFRYAINNKIGIADSENMDITPQYEHEYGFINDIIERALLCFGMVDETGHLNQAALAMRDSFATRVAEKFHDHNIEMLSADQLAPLLGEFVTELKNSGDPQQMKLAFALYGLHQNWTVGPAMAFGMIARKAFGTDRFPESGTVVDQKKTHYDVKFEGDKVAVSTTMLLRNKDYETAGIDYQCHLTTKAVMQENGMLDVSFTILLDHLPGERAKLDTLVKLLNMAEFENHTKGVKQFE
jgi:hypothetical protein